MTWIAAIDVGSNAIRLVCVSVGESGVTRQSVSKRFALRLGSEVFATGRLGPKQIKALERVFDQVAAICQRHGVEHYRAVATSAFRDAKNGRAVLQRIRARTGIQIEIIHGREEGELARVALQRALGKIPSSTLLVDLGGGSLELSRRERVVSLPLGHVRLLRELPVLAGPLSPGQLEEVEALIYQRLRRGMSLSGAAPLGVGTGGNLSTLARLCPVHSAHLPTLDLTRLRQHALELARYTPAQRRRRYALRADRADVLLGASLVLLALHRAFRTRALVVPGTGLRQALLSSLLLPAPLDDVGLTLARACSLAPRHASRTAQLAAALFEQLLPAHGLWPNARSPLAAAAYLSHAGRWIDPNRALAHTSYIVEHAAALPLSARQRQVAVSIMAEAEQEQGYTLRGAWSDADRLAVRQLGAILRVARALSDKPRPINISFLGERPHIRAKAWSATQRAALKQLNAALGVPLRVVT